MTKKELIGKKFITYISSTVYTITNHYVGKEVNVRWINDGGGVKYTVEYLNEKFKNNIWTLLPIKTMENTIEVGDIVRSIMFNDEDLIVKSIIDTRLQFTKGTWLDISDVKLKLKVNEQEVIGYELLKDLPGIPAGTISKLTTSIHTEHKFGLHTYTIQELQDTTWFKPVYKAIKPTEVFVDTLAGKVKVNSKYVALSNGDMLRIEAVAGISNLLQDIKGSYNFYELKLETFKLGCKTFHVDDIAKIQEAIKQVQ